MSHKLALMNKKSIQMVKHDIFNFKLKLKFIIEEVNPLGTSLDSATAAISRTKNGILRLKTVM